MSEEVKVSVPNVCLSDLEDLVKKIRNVTEKEDTEISFEFIIASLFPTSWKNIQSDLSRQHTLGYIQGKADAEEAMKKRAIFASSGDDADCYCE
jgi:hypothetical protein